MTIETLHDCVYLTWPKTRLALHVAPGVALWALHGRVVADVLVGQA